MRFTKSHGLGNAYLVLESGESVAPGWVRQVCDVHTGIGSDGVLEPTAGDGADFGLRIWNPDGSEAEISGNGLRIFARWLVDERGAPDRFTVSTKAGLVRCHVEGVIITVSMGTARLDPADVPVSQPLKDSPIEIAGATLRCTAVGMGNPHCVVFLEGELDAHPWRTWGPQLEHHPLFPNRTNVQFAAVRTPSLIEARIWERGAGETPASGSSACAIAAAARWLGHTVGATEVRMPGGSLHIDIDEAWAVTMAGPAEPVALITWSGGGLD
jgi:diaminopimelate epimerase